MKIVLAPQSFKGSLSAKEVASAMEKGVLGADPQAETVIVPVADGGDGSLDILIQNLDGMFIPKTVTGPNGVPVEAHWGVVSDGKTAIIELAQASGIALLETGKLDPLNTTTYGTGELILAALDAGCKRIVLMVGGSATHDIGAGIFQALGGQLIDKKGNPLKRGGKSLLSLDRIDVSHVDLRLKKTELIVGCDVTNPLLGNDGAAATYASQKGANPEQVCLLESASQHVADVFQEQLGVKVHDLKRGGAAGGVAAGMYALLGAKLVSGAGWIFDVIEFSEKIKGADLVITGEGRIDSQTPYQKAPAMVARIAKEQGIPVVAIVGSLGDGYQDVYDCGIDAIISLTSDD